MSEVVPDSLWALIVVDMQNDFLHGAGYYARRSGGAGQETHGLRSPSIGPVIQNVRTVVEQARTNRLPIAFLRAVYHRDFGIVPPSLVRNPDRQDYPCKPGTWGAEFIEPIATLIESSTAAELEAVVDKHTYNGFHETSLQEFLLAHGVGRLVICGTETQVCVLATAQQGAFHGYRVAIVEDAVWSANPQAARCGLDIFRDAYGDTVTTAELAAHLRT